MVEAGGRVLEIPDFSLVVLVGPSGSGKSTFAARHFRPSEVLSSDTFRGLVADDAGAQDATVPAFEALHFVAGKRLEGRRLAVVDATNVQEEARKPLLDLARRWHALPVAIVLDIPERLCQERNRARPDRDFGPHVVRNQVRDLRRSLRGRRGGGLSEEGFRYVHVLRSPEEGEAARIVREPLWTDRRGDAGPFDVVGDIHGCYDELRALLETLRYEVEESAPGVPASVAPPAGRKLVFLGDLVDRGPNVSGVLRLAMGMVEAGTALCVPGNHEAKLLRKLRGKDVRITHGLAETLAQLEREPAEFRAKVAQFLDGLVSHYVLDGGRLVVAHAGVKAELQGRASGEVREFCLYGETTGETDEFGLPVRYDWASDYRGRAAVVYGHTPLPEAEWLNGTICLDTGCVFGGKLTALRWPERELLSVPAARVYYEPAKPFPAAGAPGPLTAQQRADELLDLADVLGKRHLTTRLRGTITVREENAAAALEAMSRFAADPRWLVHLPPTMSPCETSGEEGLLEHPAEAFAYFRQNGVPRVVCEEKHMGSRAVLVLARSEEAARRRFGAVEAGRGACLTRTGRRFFEDAALEEALLDRVRAAAEAAGLWERLRTDWLVLDAELLPWSAKARNLLVRQYAAVGAAARAGLGEAVAALDRAAPSQPEAALLLDRFRARADRAVRYVEAYRRYCWPVRGIEDLKLAPFHVLASEGAVHADKDHLWHLGALADLARADSGLLLATGHLVVDVTDPESAAAGVRWWEELTGRGGEGMVVKPLDFVARGPRGLVQPAVKCRGKEYLRIIYGPDYDAPENIARLRKRGLARKRSLALAEFALGIEALERFVRGEPLRRVHECVFAVLAMESEPVDPRL
ncbi:MAG: polynucleotide kinase-phosphatase [Planctomycetales bacterium]|nr:polynucleotide kinase-phosphatase [Planctomycetales bacterium]